MCFNNDLIVNHNNVLTLTILLHSQVNNKQILTLNTNRFSRVLVHHIPILASSESAKIMFSSLSLDSSSVSSSDLKSSIVEISYFMQRGKTSFFLPLLPDSKTLSALVLSPTILHVKPEPRDLVIIFFLITSINYCPCASLASSTFTSHYFSLIFLFKSLTSN